MTITHVHTVDVPAALKALLLLGYPVAVIAFDVFLKLAGRDTISMSIQRAARRRPILAFALGFLAGGLAVHFFPF